jgi:hypothetical protein
MSKLDKDKVIAAFTEAYTAQNGKAPTIEAKGGWYSIDGGKNMRLVAIDAMVAELSSSTTVKKSEAVAEKPKKSTENKPATLKKVAKAPSKNIVKKTNFSVKEFWAKKILGQGSGYKLPR